MHSQSTTRNSALRLAARAGKIGVGSAIAVLAIACGSSGNPGPGSPSYKTGALGNGGFTFRCDDSVACDRWSNSAQTFPTQVAAGSAFELNFFPKNESTGTIDIRINEPPEARGLRIEGVKSHVSAIETGRYTMTRTGTATFLARDGKGWIVDYVTVKVVKPEGLVVYDAEYKGTLPPRIKSINAKKDDRKSYRTVGQAGNEDLAGSIKVEWTSLDPNVIQIESYTQGKVTLVAKGPGKTTLKAEGGGTSEEIAVEVAQ